MKRPLALAALLLAGGCGLLDREPRTLDVELPDAWSTGTAVGDPPAAWWTRFGDPRLEALVDTALESNRSLRAAAARIETARAQARIAGADFWPQAGAGLSAGRRRQNFVGFPFPSSGGVPHTTFNTAGLSLDLSWEIDLWGRLRAHEAAAVADAEAVAADHAAARHSLVAQVSKVYFAVVEARAQLGRAEATRDNRETLASRIRSRVRLGLRPALDLRLAEANAAAANAAVQARREALDALTRQLELLAGRYPGGREQTAAVLPAPPPPPPAGLPSDLLRRRPDLVAAQRRLAAAELRIDEGEAALFPRLSLTGSGGTSSDDLSDLLDGDFRVWNIVGNLLQPIFQGGRLRAGVDLVTANADTTLALYADAVLRALGEVETALASEAILAERETALSNAVRESRQAAADAEQRYLKGLLDLVTVLESQRGLIEAESRLLETRRARLDARINLHLSLGGGFAPEEKTDE